MKLELKHLAPYLPYELGLYDVSDETTNKLTVKSNLLKEYPLDIVLDHIYLVKPILRPLKDLTNELIDQLKETHPNCPNFFGLFQPPHGWEYHKKNISNSFVEYAIFNKLCEWHFDVFGLIEKGLAIDKNTLKN